MDITTWIIIIVDGLIWGVIARQIVLEKGYEHEGGTYFFIGFFLSLLGVILAYAKPDLNNAKQDQQMSMMMNAVLNNNSLGWTCSCGYKNSYDAIYCMSCGKKRQSDDTSKSISDQLNEIKALYDQGLITEDEYNAKKKQILGL